MQSTGIVRRMDELGRVVIPKELRRIMRIREGEELAVYATEDALILKKFSAVSEMIDFQQEYASSIYRTTGFTAFITDNDRVVAMSGDLGKCPLGTAIGDLLEDVISSRKVSAYDGINIKPFFDGNVDKVLGQVVAPILMNGDVMGAVVLYLKKEPTELAVKTAETCAHFIAGRL